MIRFQGTLPSTPADPKARRTDVVIIGGGAGGILTAFHLLRRDVVSVAADGGRVGRVRGGLPVARLRITFLDMDVRARIALCASLAFVAPQLTLERTSTAEDGADDAAAWLQLHSQPHPETDGAHTRLPDHGLHRLQATPFAPAAHVDVSPSWVNTEAPAIGSSEAGASAPVILRLSRAPPALS